MEEFSTSPKHKFGRYPWCRVCSAAYKKVWVGTQSKEDLYKAHAEWRARRDADAEKRAQYLKASHGYAMKHRYGITPDHAAQLAEYQEGACAICKTIFDPHAKRKNIHVDHDHNTKVVRGLLCDGCNLGLGCFKDDPVRLAYALYYLHYPPTGQVQFEDPLPCPKKIPAIRNPDKHEVLELACKNCGKPIFRKASAEYRLRMKGKDGPYCGPGCGSQGTRPLKELTHGTIYGYRMHKCRCAECRGANSEAERVRKQKKGLV